jgi:hypothetical protein
MKVFLLEHIHEIESGEENVKTIGIYSSEESAKQAIIRLSTQPGFNNNVKGFSIDCYELDQDNWTEGFITTWVNESGEIEYES